MNWYMYLLTSQRVSEWMKYTPFKRNMSYHSVFNCCWYFSLKIKTESQAYQYQCCQPITRECKKRILIKWAVDCRTRLHRKLKWLILWFKSFSIFIEDKLCHCFFYNITLWIHFIDVGKCWLGIQYFSSIVSALKRFFK